MAGSVAGMRYQKMAFCLAVSATSVIFCLAALYSRLDQSLYWLPRLNMARVQSGSSSSTFMYCVGMGGSILVSARWEVKVVVKGRWCR